MGAVNFFNRHRKRSKIYYFLIIIVLMIIGGSSGFMLIEDWSFVDSFYMTIITVSTVGFGEVNELSSSGKLFTSVLIFFTFGTFAYALSSITSYVVGGDYKRYIQKQRIMKELNRLQDHIIVCGFGRVGKQVADDLASHNIEFVVVEKVKDLSAKNEESKNTHYLLGDGTNDETLLLAGIKNARAVITCLPKDADNLYVVLASREHNKNVLIVSRASANSAVSKLKMAGANNVIMPDSVGGAHMASLIVNRDVMEFLDMIRVQGSKGTNVQSITFNELPEKLRSMSIGELDQGSLSDVRIIGYKGADGEYVINPPSDLILSQNSRLFVLGEAEQIEGFLRRFGLENRD